MSWGGGVAREFPCSDFPPPPPAPPGFSLRGEVPEVAGLDEAKIPHPRPEKNPNQRRYTSLLGREPRVPFFGEALVPAGFVAGCSPQDQMA